MDCSETIAACDLKVGRYRQLIEKLKICGYLMSIPWPKVFYTLTLKLAFLLKPQGHFNQIVYVSL